MPGQGRLGDKASLQLDAHGCPACPHPAIGPAIQGSPDVNVNRRPALRVDDPGLHMACCGTNTWTATKGSRTVIINGKSAHRMGDQNRHCGGMGQLVEGSPNVIVGESEGGSAGASEQSLMTATLLSANGIGQAALLLARVDAQRQVDGRQSSQAATTEGSLGGDRDARSPTLDPIEAPNSLFEVRFVDELDEPITGLGVTFHVDGRPMSSVTDGSGVARITVPAAGPCRVEVNDTAQLRDLVRSRWDRVRQGTRLTRDDGVAVRLLKDPFEGLPLEKEVRRTVSIQPEVVMARLFGLLFDTSKNFLLPTSIITIQDVRAFYDDHPASALLIVGHTDTSGRPTYNDALSLERADAMKAFLTNDVDAWLARFKDNVSPEKRWGDREQSLMIQSVLTQPDFEGIGPADDPVLFFQQRHNQQVRQGTRSGDADANETSDETDTEILKEDGQLGSRTRRALVRAYMRHDRTTLPRDVTVVTHGCGENFPLDALGDELDSSPADGSHEQEDRRVELLFFDGKLGVQPRPPGRSSAKNSQEYPEWRRRAGVLEDFGNDTSDPDAQDLILRFVGWDGKPQASKKYRLQAGGVPLRGKTDPDGMLRERLPPGARSATLVWGDDAELWTVELDVSPLADVAETGGVQTRLRNLGYLPAGFPLGTFDDVTREATRQFQVEHVAATSRPAGGELDDVTRRKLRDRHGC